MYDDLRISARTCPSESIGIGSGAGLAVAMYLVYRGRIGRECLPFVAGVAAPLVPKPAGCAPRTSTTTSHS